MKCGAEILRDHDVAYGRQFLPQASSCPQTAGPSGHWPSGIYHPSSLTFMLTEVSPIAGIGRGNHDFYVFCVYGVPAPVLKTRHTWRAPHGHRTDNRGNGVPFRIRPDVSPIKIFKIFHFQSLPVSLKHCPVSSSVMPLELLLHLKLVCRILSRKYEQMRYTEIPIRMLIHSAPDDK